MAIDLIAIKQRYGIIGHSPLLDYAIHIAVQVAPTDLSVLILGESGVGKESFPKIIHDYSACKHGQYITVNCGAIPEGTIDSELFGHEKGSFTGATDTRKGYFEVADGGTIFLDEVADLPLATQVRLLRVLETGDFMKVGSSKVQKTRVRVVAATNVNIADRIAKGKFREDLYYRLNTVPIQVPALREREDDIILLFKKFSSDFALKYRFPQLELTEGAVTLMKEYRWPGNVRQLKNLTEQISLIEKDRLIDTETLQKYLASVSISSLPVLLGNATNESEAKKESLERELLFKFLGDLRREVTELKSMVNDIVRKYGQIEEFQNAFRIDTREQSNTPISFPKEGDFSFSDSAPVEELDNPIILEESYSLMDTEKELIKKVLEKHDNVRKWAAQELGISERTLYRKIKEYGL